MRAVFNTDFKHMWRDEVPTTTLDALYSSDSEYAFPLLSGAAHDTTLTFQMRYSKHPSSPEFDAIQWHEGHTVIGTRPDGTIGAGQDVLSPYLLAYIDIDNDGIPDTVIKEGFSRGYAWMSTQGEADATSAETLITYRDTELDQSAPTTFAALTFPSAGSDRIISMTSGYLRPFIYQGRTYIATYSQGSYRTPTRQSRANLKKDIPPHEAMYVFSYSYSGVRNAIGRPRWTADTLCVFDMIQTQ